MKKILKLSFLLLLTIQACGPSRAEIEANILRAQAVADSINAEFQRQAEEQASLKQKLIDLKSQLAGAETKLLSIEEFKILRTQDEKAQQVEDQTRVIEELKSQIEEVEKQIQ